MDQESLKEASLLVFSFLCGAYACGLLIDKNQVHFMGKAFYGLALVLNSSLLVTAAFIPGSLLPVCLVSAACGLQNAMCTSHFGAIIRTTHVTGTVTDIGSTFGRISMIYIRKGCRCSKLDDVERAEVGVDARKLAVLFGLWSFYFMGGLFGVYMEPWRDKTQYTGVLRMSSYWRFGEFTAHFAGELYRAIETKWRVPLPQQIFFPGK